MINTKGQHRRCQQQDGHHRALGEVLLADHQFENVGRQHIEVAANHLGDTEVGHDQREGDQGRRDQTVLGARQGDGEELAPHRGSHGVRRLKQARIGQTQRCDQNHQRVRKDSQTLGQQNARCAVNLCDAHTLHPVLEHALVAKPVDQGNGRQQGGRQQRDQRDASKQGFEGHAGARQCVGKGKSQRHHDQRHRARNPQTVPQAAEQGRRLRVFNKVVEPDELTVMSLQCLQQNRRKRCRQKGD